jgi:E3 ubiquitin-protein ligase RNF139
MAFRTKFLALVDVILRVPPLFIMDELLRIGLGLPQGTNNYYNSSFEVDDADVSIIEDELPPTIPDYANTGVQYDVQFYKVLVATVIKFILSCMGKLYSPYCNTE